MKTIKTILEEINILFEFAPSLSVQPQRPVTDSDVAGGFGPNDMPLFNYKVLAAAAPDTQQQGEYVPGGNGFSIHRGDHENLKYNAMQYGIDIGPLPGSQEAQMLKQMMPNYKHKNLFILNNIIKHRERTSEIYNRLQKLALAPFANEHIKDYTNPENQDIVQTMEPNYDMTGQQQVGVEDYNDAADVGGIS